MKILGIMGALPQEVDLVAATLQDATVEQYAGVEYHIGQRAGLRLVVCCGGMGKANAASTTQVLITRYGVEAILFSGIAGSTNDLVGIGDVVIGSETVYHDAENRMLAQSAPGTSVYKADAALVDAAEKACDALGVHYVVGRIATGDQFIGDSDTKARIQQACNPDCVEMEGAAVGQIAMRNGVPFVVLRAMSDKSDTSVEELGAEEFDISAYVATSSAIVGHMVDGLGKAAE